MGADGEGGRERGEREELRMRDIQTDRQTKNSSGLVLLVEKGQKAQHPNAVKVKYSFYEQCGLILCFRSLRSPA